MSVSAPTDEELVRRARDGDEAAAKTLCDRWMPAMRARVSRGLRGVLRRRVAESDVVQEAYLTAFRRMEDFEDRGEGSFGRWLAKIVDVKLQELVRRHIGTAKRDVRRETLPAEGGGGDVAGRESTPSAGVVRAEEREALAKAMRDLPEDYRTVLHLAYHQRLPMVEIGRLTERSEEAAGMLHARALKALGRLLPRNGGDR